MNVKEILQTRNIAFKEANNDFVIRCLNPEHEDRNPSLRVDKTTGIFGCFSCGFAGNLYTHFGIDQSLIDIKVITLKKKLDSLKYTSISMPLGAEPYNASYRGVSVSTLTEFGAFTCPQDKFDDRIVFPIRNILGQIVGFVARHLYSDEEPKYLVIPEHAKMGLYPARPNIIKNSIILVEGIFDMLNLYDGGLTNTVCMFGVSFGAVKKRQKIEENIKKLEQYKIMGASKIYLLLDGDEAGQKAARNMEKNYSKDFVIENIELPDGVDPGSLSKQHVKELKEYLYGKDSIS